MNMGAYSYINPRLLTAMKALDRGRIEHIHTWAGARRQGPVGGHSNGLLLGARAGADGAGAEGAAARPHQLPVLILMKETPRRFLE